LNQVAARESVKVIVEDAPIEEESSEGMEMNSLRRTKQRFLAPREETKEIRKIR